MEIYNKTISRPLADLHFHPANPRDHSEESTKRLAESIKEDPTYFEAHPILLSDRTGELVIIGGEGRCRAARFLGMTEAPTFLFEGLTEEDEVRIMQKDNSHTGKWDDAKLAEMAQRWGEDKMKSWAPGINWIKPGGIDISGLFAKDEHPKEAEQKWNEIRIIVSPEINLNEVRTSAFEHLAEIFGDKVRMK